VEVEKEELESKPNTKRRNWMEQKHKKLQARTTTHRTQKGPRSRELGENKGHNFDTRGEGEGEGRRTQDDGPWVDQQGEDAKWRRDTLDGPNNAQVQLDKCRLSQL